MASLANLCPIMGLMRARKPPCPGRQAGKSRSTRSSALRWNPTDGEARASRRTISRHCPCSVRSVFKNFNRAGTALKSCETEINKDAKFFDALSFDDAISKNLKVMDATALTLARDHGLPINVFNVNNHSALKDIICGKKIGTLIS